MRQIVHLIIYIKEALSHAAAGSTPAVAATKQNPRWEKREIFDILRQNNG